MNYKKSAYILAMAKLRKKVNKEECCQYRGGDERWCRMTTNTSCNRCRFFQPNTNAVFEACVENVERAHDLYRKCAKSHTDLTQAAATAQRAADKADALMLEIEEKNKLLDLGGTVEMLMREVWEASVNSYE